MKVFATKAMVSIVVESETKEDALIGINTMLQYITSMDIVNADTDQHVGATVSESSARLDDIIDVTDTMKGFFIHENNKGGEPIS